MESILMNDNTISEKPIISVIVPVYNIELYLKKCVVSILEQAYGNLEIILIDDGSTDNSSCLCDLLAKNDSRITVIHQKNRGLSAARNTGIEHAHGSYIAFIDGDDYISPFMIEKLYNRIRMDCSDIAVCGFKRVSESYQELDCVSIPDLLISGQDAVRMHYQETKGIMQIVCNKLYKISLFDTVRFPVGKIHEDDFTFYRILDISKRVSILSDALYYYVQRKNSIMSAAYSIKRLDGIEASYERIRFYLSTGDKFKDLVQDEGKNFLWLFSQSKLLFHPKNQTERKRVHEINKMGREICRYRELNWMWTHKFILLTPEVYALVKKMKDRILKRGLIGD